MLRNKPKSRYSGLTVIMSNPSRFDNLYLLSANGGVLFNDCLQPEFNTMMCDVRVMEDTSPILADTKCILLLGEAAMHSKCEKETFNNTLNEMRGTVLHVNGIPAIASYFPQDAVDFKAYEQRLNTESKEYSSDDEEADDEDDEGDVKRFSPTKRSNYAFWLSKDVARCKYIIKNGVPSSRVSPTYKIYPSADEVINILTNTKQKYFYFDMETDYEEANILCFSFSFNGITIYCVPVLDYNYKWAYSALHYIFRALTICIRDNIIVAHNGSGFDFLVLGYKYRIPIVRCYDTMLAQHRCYPDVEKSLGHGTSLWTWERFHKDTDSRSYTTREHMTKKLQYCGKDVYTMFLIHQEIEDFSKKIPGLADSIKCANDSIRPYLTTTIQGISYNQEKVKVLQQENDKLMMQYNRCINLLIGEEGIHEVRQAIKGNKPKAFAGSNSQCCNYFHNMLGYPVLWRSTKTGKPSLGKKILYRLALKYPENPVIQFTLLYRVVKEENKPLQFVPWKDDKGQIYVEPEDPNLLQQTNTIPYKSL